MEEEKTMMNKNWTSQQSNGLSRGMLKNMRLQLELICGSSWDQQGRPINKQQWVVGDTLQ
jgi:hypothetical protein